MIVRVVMIIGMDVHGLNVLILSIHLCVVQFHAIIAIMRVVVHLSSAAIAPPLFLDSGRSVHIPDLVHY